MKADTKSLLNDYVNGISDLQKKYKKDNEKFVLLALLLIYVIEYMTSKNAYFVHKYAPILIKNDIQDSKKFLTNLDKGIKGKGELKDDLRTFQNTNSPILNYITNTRKSPQKAPILAITKGQRLLKLEEEASLMEQTNDISLLVNQMIFNKKRKVWNTQNDDLVRKTMFHQNIANVSVDINETFNEGGMSALFPAHSTLPAHERYNCRCYLTYE